MLAIILSFFMAMLTNEAQNNDCNNGIEGIYIYEYVPKELGAYVFGFIEIDSLLNIEENAYKVSFIWGEIQVMKYRNVFLRTITHKTYKELNDIDKIKFGIRNFHCSKSEEYLANKEFPDKIYNSIDEKFLKVNNYERRKILENLLE